MRGDQRHAALVRVRLDLEVRGEVVVVADGDDVETVRDARRRSTSFGERVPSE